MDLKERTRVREGVKALLDCRLKDVEMHVGVPNFSSYTIEFLIQLGKVDDLLNATTIRNYEKKYQKLVDMHSG